MDTFITILGIEVLEYKKTYYLNHNSVMPLSSNNTSNHGFVLMSNQTRMHVVTFTVSSANEAKDWISTIDNLRHELDVKKSERDGMKGLYLSICWNDRKQL